MVVSPLEPDSLGSALPLTSCVLGQFRDPWELQSPHLEQEDDPSSRLNEVST